MCIHTLLFCYWCCLLCSAVRSNFGYSSVIVIGFLLVCFSSSFCVCYVSCCLWVASLSHIYIQSSLSAHEFFVHCCSLYCELYILVIILIRFSFCVELLYGFLVLLFHVVLVFGVCGFPRASARFARNTFWFLFLISFFLVLFWLRICPHLFYFRGVFSVLGLLAF